MDPGVAALESGLMAVGSLHSQIAAVSGHPAARTTFALDPEFIAAIERARVGQSILAAVRSAEMGQSGGASRELREVLSREVAVAQGMSATPLATRFAAHAAAARLASSGARTVQFSHADTVDFTGSAVLLSLLAGGYAHELAGLARKHLLSRQDVQLIATAFARACGDVMSKMKQATANGSVEVLALPSREPILPLLIDAAGRNRQVPFTVAVNARADAAAAVDDGLRAARALQPDSAGAGLLSPHGAYDDATAALLYERQATYAVFSERVAKAAGGASVQAHTESLAAAYHGYMLDTGKNEKLPVLFCATGASDRLEALADDVPATALGDRVSQIALGAWQDSGQKPDAVVVLCLSAAGRLAARIDRDAALSHLFSVLGSGAFQSFTPKEYLRAHPPSAAAYGFSPASDTGGFGLWMGSANQSSMWNALADARAAAGGDASLSRTSVRAALLRAESGYWYAAVRRPQPRAVSERLLADFREAIAAIYRAADKPAPRSIAPVRWDSTAAPGD